MSVTADRGGGAGGGPSNLGGNINGTMDPSGSSGPGVQLGDASGLKTGGTDINGTGGGHEDPHEETKPAGHPHNPQLGPEPWFTYPTPTPSQLQEDLPPYDETEGLPMGLVLDRVVRKGYGDMKVLLGQTLPHSSIKQRPRHIIDYAKSQRQAILKYLAVLRWKMAVDIDLPGPSNASTIPHPHPLANGSALHGITSFPTPHSIGESSNTSPSAEVIPFGKGKGKAVEDEKPLKARGKVTDAKRITHFMEHQNRQHELAIGHIQHVSKMIETLRERNPDLLTAVSLLEFGTYTRFPTALKDAFTPLVPLTNRRVLRTLRRLNRTLWYRLKCVDYVPPELVIRAVKDGKVYVGSGGSHGWRADLTVIGFGEGDEARWWLTGVEWGWRYKGRGVYDPGGEGFRKVTGEARQGILDIVNEQILRPREVDPSGGKAETEDGAEEGGESHSVDAPLVRLVNFLQHVYLTQQLEALYVEAIKLNQGRWRGNLQAEMKRDDNSLTLRYWIRPRPPPAPAAGQAPNQPKRPPEPRFMFGGSLTVSVAETGKASMVDDLMRDVTSAGRFPMERVLPLCLDVKWEIGEAGAGGGLKAGDKMDASSLQVDSDNLSLESILSTAAQAHASHLLRVHTASLDLSRLTLFPLDPPSLIETSSMDSADSQASFRIPLPSKHRATSLNISVSPYTGRLEIEDEAGNEGRAMRARMATVSLNESKARFTDDLVRLITAILTENLENQMRQLGWSPTRRLPIRYQDLPKNDLYPASSIFVPLSSSSLHLFVAKITPAGIAFELLRLVRAPADGGVMKIAIGDRSAIDLARLKARRMQAEGGQLGQAQDFGVDTLLSAVVQGDTASTSTFEMSNRDLRDLYVFSNALVAQTIIEQQLKDRSIPYTLQYPAVSGEGAPHSTSAVAGMVPSLVVNTRDLLKDPRVAEVAMPKVYIQLRNWWKGKDCQVVTVVQLRHRPSLASNGTSPQAPLVSVPSSSADSESIILDPVSSVVRFKESDIGRCVPSFLEEWERLSKVLVVAGEVNRLNKTPQFKHLKMLSFDLSTATLSYAAGYSCSITYTPSDDSYEVSFASTSETGAEVQENPHEMLQGLFSHKLNKLSKRRNSKISLARAFCELLCNTLPILLTIKSLQSPDREFPKLVVRSLTSYRLVWDHEAKRYALDLTLLPSNRYLLSDGSAPPDQKPDLSCGPLTPIPGFTDHTGKICAPADTAEGPGDVDGGLIRLDDGNAFMCPVESVGAVTRSTAGAIENAIGYKG